jgi:glycine cleavage system aminomethyltransferase T
MNLLATPFHARAAQSNRHNAWETRGGFTLATCYSDTEEEALAARFGAVITDVSWHWRIELSGAQVVEFVSRLFTRNVASLRPGFAMEALWLNDTGAVRGAGTVARLADDTFLLFAAREDASWITSAARLYDVTVRERTTREGVLALIGPASFRLLRAAGLDAAVAPMTFGSIAWRGLDVTISRFGLGFELWCDSDSALIVWDRLRAAGRRYALRPAGQAALDILEFESGIMRAGRDYAPARDGFAAQPSPQSLGLSALVDRSHIFNGRAGVLAAGPDTSLGGVLLDSETPVDKVALTHQGREIGHTLAARYSPAMRCAIAFAILNGPWPASAVSAGATPCRPAALPFLPLPAPMDATETATAAV